MKTFLNKYFMAFLVVLLTASNASAQTSNSFVSDYLPEIVLTIAVSVSIIILIVLIVVLNVLKALINQNREVNEKVVVEPTISWWSLMMKKMTDAVPIERENDVLTDHAYDGIRELDNRLPPWWTAMFYITIVFAVAYLLHYHVFNTGIKQDQEYLIELADAETKLKTYQASLALSIDETNVTVTSDALALAEGREIYESKCSACHANDGGGGIGPNMTDAYWIHGGDINSIFKIVKYGVSQKGMISWSNQLTPAQMQNVSSYILTFQGTSPANPKEPQGDLFELVSLETGENISVN